MNYRALALGALAGFLFALAPSCGSTQKCGPDNCDGCCDAEGQCLALDQQNSNYCGVEGLTCAACGTGETCSEGECIVPAPPDAGPSLFQACQDKANAEGKDGCCTDTGTWRAGTARSNCGGGNELCADCDEEANEQCIVFEGARQCLDPDSVPHVGGNCTTDADCASIGEGAICKKTTSTGNASYPGGYCTIGCGGNPSICTSDSLCMDGRNTALFGEADSICWEKCSTNADCSEGYGCYNLDQAGTMKACWLTPLPERNAGPAAPAGTIGKACTQDSECGPPPENAVCIEETTADGGARGFPNGYCTVDCTNTAADVCGTGGVCLSSFLLIDQELVSNNPQIVGGDGCAQRCEEPNTVSSCNTGYVCAQLFTRDAQGNVTPLDFGFCTGSCLEEGVTCSTGFVCETEGEQAGQCVEEEPADAGQ